MVMILIWCRCLTEAVGWRLGRGRGLGGVEGLGGVDGLGAAIKHLVTFTFG